MKFPIVSTILLSLCVAQAACRGEDEPPDVAAWVRQIESGDLKEFAKSAANFRSPVPYKTRQRLHEFVEGMFARKEPLSLEDQSRLGAAINLLGRIGDHHDSLMLARHLRWEYSGTLLGRIPDEPYARYVCVRAMVRIGAISLPVFAEVLAGTDDEVDIELARSGVEGIGRTAMFTTSYYDLEKHSRTFARAYLEAAAALRKDPKEVERLKRAASYFEEKLKRAK